MYAVLIVSVIIVLAVLLISVITTSKAYGYKHIVDPLEENPHLDKIDSQKDRGQKIKPRI
ncbi:YtzI protein [Bacillus sp. V33-4]|uniref:YtzI protein n=1 Tax=Bacillus sp. V33-4 TaxID=2054169 RepID=UPI000C78ED6C|nr:YtzI protein [Bacillus sp. V33-4]PLR86973.1 YtzI protein [Bacillus sp. V33-4]